MAWKNDQVSESETEKIITLAREQVSCEGDFVELGCYKGDTSLLLAEVLNDLQSVACGKPVENFVKKRLWIYDSFEGLPEKNKVDESSLGEDFKKGELEVTKREVKERFLRAGLPVPIIKKAWFNELVSEDLPKKIALAFLDGDFYESIEVSLRLIEDKIAKNGVIIVHDYRNAALPGVAKAVDKWIRGRGFKKEHYQSMVVLYNNEKDG